MTIREDIISRAAQAVEAGYPDGLHKASYSVTNDCEDGGNFTRYRWQFFTARSAAEQWLKDAEEEAQRTRYTYFKRGELLYIEPDQIFRVMLKSGSEHKSSDD